MSNDLGFRTGSNNSGNGFVPYEGATQDVDLGENALNAKSVKINGTGGAGHSGFRHQSSNATAGGQETAVFAGSDGEMYYKNASNAVAQFASREWVGSNYQIDPIVVSGNITAANDTNYTNVANATYTDPSPVEGKGYDVLVVNGTATIGGVAYSLVGTTIKRRFHSGGWVSFKYFTQGNSTIITLVGDVSTTDATNGAAIFTFAMTANTSYIVRGRLSISSGNASGTKLGTVFPSGAIPYYVIFGRTSDINTFRQSGHSNTSGAFNANALNTVASTTGFGYLEGEVQCSATAGNLQITFAPVTNGQTSSILSLGTYIEIIEK